jgi:hypothetical protein
VAYTLQRPGGSSRVALVDPATGEDQEVAHGFPFVQPFAVAVDAAGNVIVTDPGDFTGLSRLIRFDIGVGASIRHDGEGAFSGIAVEPTGAILVTDVNGVLRVDPVTGGQATVASMRGAVGLAVRR